MEDRHFFFFFCPVSGCLQFCSLCLGKHDVHLPEKSLDFLLVLFYTWCRPQCLCYLPVWCHGWDVKFDCICSWFMIIVFSSTILTEHDLIVISRTNRMCLCATFSRISTFFGAYEFSIIWHLNNPVGFLLIPYVVVVAELVFNGP